MGKLFPVLALAFVLVPISPLPVLEQTLSPINPDLRTSSNANLVRTLEGGAFKEVAINGDIVYGGLHDFLVAIDVSDKSNPARLGNALLGNELSTSQVMDIAVSGNYAYVANADSGLTVIDISDPTNLVEVGAATGVEARASMASVTSILIFPL